MRSTMEEKRMRSKKKFGEEDGNSNVDETELVDEEGRKDVMCRKHIGKASSRRVEERL